MHKHTDTNLITSEKLTEGTKEHRKIVCDTIFEEHDKEVLKETLEKYSNKVLPSDKPYQTLQLHWINWCNYIRNDFSWKAIWATGPDLFRFAIQSTFNTMSCPKNKVRWKESSDSSCQLCSHTPGTIPHILSNCSFSLANGRYTFRHDSVVKVQVEAILYQIGMKKTQKPPPKVIVFVKQGEMPKKKNKKPISGVLDSANDWILLCDLGDLPTATVPPCLALTSERPDIVLYSPSTRQVILIENTSGCEENFENAHSLKLIRYDILVSSIIANGWTVNFFCVEVGARGYCSTSMSTCLSKLGFPTKYKRETLKKL